MICSDVWQAGLVQGLADQVHLGVVGGHHQDVLLRQRARRLVGTRRPPQAQMLLYLGNDFCGFLRGGLLVLVHTLRVLADINGFHARGLPGEMT